MRAKTKISSVPVMYSGSAPTTLVTAVKAELVRRPRPLRSSSPIASPRGKPRTTTTTRPPTATEAVSGSRWLIISVTGCCVVNDVPRSPWKMPRT